MGSSSAASSVDRASKAAPGSRRQGAPALRRRAPRRRRSARAAGRQVARRSSRPGAIMPARAPASIDMLHTVMRSSMSRARMPSPRYSSTCPVPPSTPIWPMIASTRSLALTPGRSFWFTLMAKVFGLRCRMHCVANTWPTSVVPMPKARAPKAPWVLVWLSPQTMVRPGRVRPSSGPMMCTMPRRLLCMSSSSMPASAQLRSSCWTWRAAAVTAIGTPPKTCSVRVGVEWSMVASVRSRRRTDSWRSCSTWKACGVVTSWMRCRSMYSTAGVSAVSGATSCCSQTFWNMVLGMSDPKMSWPAINRSARARRRPARHGGGCGSGMGVARPRVSARCD